MRIEEFRTSPSYGMGVSINSRAGLRDGPCESFATARKERASSGGASSARTELDSESKHFSVRPEEPPSFGGVSKGCLGENRQSLGESRGESSADWTAFAEGLVRSRRA